MGEKDSRKKVVSTDPFQEAGREDQPYEKFLRFGPENLTESELLAIILRTGTKGESALKVAQKVMMLGAYPRTGLLGLVDVSLEDLTTIPGIGYVKAIKLKSIAELAVRIRNATAQQGFRGTDPETVAEFFMEQMRHLRKEHVILASLDAKCQLIAQTRLSEGSVNLSLISPRSLFLEALQTQAVNLILVHNHPSGDPQPSGSDISITHRIYQLGRMMDIPLLDHIIIGDNKYYSFRAHGRLEPEGGEDGFDLIGAAERYHEEKYE